MKSLEMFLAAVMSLVAFTRTMAATYSVAPTTDARVIAYPGYQTLNFASDILSVYTESSALNTQRTLIYFDLSAVTLATNQAVQRATLTLTASTGFGNNSSNRPMEIYRLVSPWTETGVTWTNRDATHAWTNSGGDFTGIASQPYGLSTSSPTNLGSVTWDITDLVQEWVTHASPNYGLLLKSETGNHLTFYQRESATASLRPNLTIVTGPPPIHSSRGGGNLVLWWTGAGLVLQEKTNLNSSTVWSDSSRIVMQSGNSNSVTISAPTGNHFFRLRSGP